MCLDESLEQSLSVKESGEAYPGVVRDVRVVPESLNGAGDVGTEPDV